MHSSIITWQSLSEPDLVIIDQIATAVHTGLPERVDVFAEKLRLFPQGCLKLVHEGTIIGYGLSHPWTLFSIPPLNEFLTEIPPDANCLYVHDVCLLPEARGQKAAEKFMEEIHKVAQILHLPKLACVSVYGTDTLWERYGFKTTVSPALAAKLNTYGETAKYMTADVGSGIGPSISQRPSPPLPPPT